MKIQKGLSFNGSSDYGAIPASTFSAGDWNGSVTLSFWLFVPASTTNTPVLDNEWGQAGNCGGFQVFINNNGHLFVNTYGTSTSNPDATNSKNSYRGIWIKVAVTKNVTTHTQVLYVNGGNLEVVTNSSTIYGCNPPTTQLCIGTGNRLGSPSFSTAQISEITIYNRDLSSVEILNDFYNAYTAAMTSSMSHHWDFHEGSGSTVSDIVGTVNFTLTGCTWVDTYTKLRTLA